MNLAYLMFETQIPSNHCPRHLVCIRCGKNYVMVVDSSQKNKAVEEFQLHPLDGEIKSCSFKTTMVLEAAAPSMLKALGQTQ